MSETRLFCQEHWDELVPEIRNNDLNGIALQPLAVKALLSHEDILDHYDNVIGEADNDVDLVVEDAAPICCTLSDRDRYADGTDYEDDYAILVDAARYPLDDMPEAFWAVDLDDTDDGRPPVANAACWVEYPGGVIVDMGDGDPDELSPDEARDAADRIEDGLREEGELGDEELAFISDLREAADDYEELQAGDD